MKKLGDYPLDTAVLAMDRMKLIQRKLEGEGETPSGGSFREPFSISGEPLQRKGMVTLLIAIILLSSQDFDDQRAKVGHRSL